MAGWWVRHRHRGPNRAECAEVLTLRPEGGATTLRLVFRAGPGRYVADGWWYSGSVTDGEELLNLHEPGVVRRFVDRVVADGLLPARAGSYEADGWPLFDALVGEPTP